jgi:hypothetical protein
VTAGYLENRKEKTMEISYRRLAALTRLAAATLPALVTASSLSAQINVRKPLDQRGKWEVADEREPRDNGKKPLAATETIVLTKDVVSRLIKGLKAGQAERQRAEQEDTPYGRYQRAQTAYTAAKSKCQAAQQAFGARMASDEKVMAKYSKLQEQQLAALEKGDQKAATGYQDQLLAMADSSCIVKEPTRRPDGYYDSQRQVDRRVDTVVVKVTGFGPGELAMLQERTTAILLGSTAGDVSASEKSVVTARAAELRPLLGMPDQPTAVATQPDPAPASAPVAEPAAPPQVDARAAEMNACLVKNVQRHQKELEALGKRMQAAQAAGDNAKLMAMADTLQRIQMAGCGVR